jgi:hypothetical protein
MLKPTLALAMLDLRWSLILWVIQRQDQPGLHTEKSVGGSRFDTREPALHSGIPSRVGLAGLVEAAAKGEKQVPGSREPDACSDGGM